MVDYIKIFTNNEHDVAINFHGGEPLLQIESINLICKNKLIIIITHDENFINKHSNKYCINNKKIRLEDSKYV